MRTLFSKNIRSESDFYAHAEATAPLIIPGGQKLLEQVLPVIAVYHEIRTLLDKLQKTYPHNQAAVAIYSDLREDLTSRLAVAAAGQLVEDVGNSAVDTATEAIRNPTSVPGNVIDEGKKLIDTLVPLLK